MPETLIERLARERDEARAEVERLRAALRETKFRAEVALAGPAQERQSGGAS